MENLKKIYKDNGFTFANRYMNNLHEKVLDAYFQVLILSKGSYKLKSSQLLYTQLNVAKQMLNSELNTLKVLMANLSTTATKELLLGFINTDEYKSDIEKLASCFNDMNSISKNLNICIVFIREKYPANTLIIGDYLFSNPLVLYIYKINKKNYDHLYHSSLLESNLFIQNSEKWLILKNLIENMLNIRMIENLNRDFLSKLLNLLYPYKDFHDKIQEIDSLINKLENSESIYNESRVIKNDVIEKPLEKYEFDDKNQKKIEIPSVPIRESKHLLAIPDENDKNKIKLFKIIGPDGRNVRIGLKRCEDLQKIIDNPMYKKVFVNDMQFPMMQNVSRQQSFKEINDTPVVEINDQKPLNLPKNHSSNSIVKYEEIFDD
ncbi:hypothetical protein SteCoe_23677 [Stentor coeruleus]|uniref:Uncharacterized protein n=1 Tax=Stentor coeruleus TaxID=5963 RepID=A0A1R2BJE5_9CILI|nr:hypothetical protein SteCoe_23677 [Stentor coeruleus]